MKRSLVLMGFLHLITGPWTRAMENPSEEEQRQAPYFGYKHDMESILQDAEEIQERDQYYAQALKDKGYQLVHSLQLDLGSIQLLRSYIETPDQIWLENKETYYNPQLLVGVLRKCFQRIKQVDQISDFARLVYHHAKAINKVLKQNKPLGDPKISFLSQQIAPEELIRALSFSFAALKVNETYPDYASSLDRFELYLSRVQSLRRANQDQSNKMYQLILQGRVLDEDQRYSFFLDLLEEAACTNLMANVLEVAKIQFLNYVDWKNYAPDLSCPRYPPYGIDMRAIDAPSEAPTATTSSRVVSSQLERRVIIPRSNPEATFVLPLIINGYSLPLSFDMAKPLVLLSCQDAQRIGVKLTDLYFSVTFEGNRGARLMLNQVSLGEFVFSNVKALVLENLEKSLSGKKLLENMNVRIKDEKLVIRKTI